MNARFQRGLGSEKATLVDALCGLALLCAVAALLVMALPGKDTTTPTETVVNETEPEPEAKPEPAPKPTPEPDPKPVEPARVKPCCGKECVGFGMDRPNCLAPDCHCGDDCQSCKELPCCPECLCWEKPTPRKPTPKPVRAPAWFFCLGCRHYSHYTAPATMRTTKCSYCGQWGAYRAVKSQEQPVYQPHITPSEPDGWRPFRPFGGFGFGFGDISNGQGCVGTT